MIKKMKGSALLQLISVTAIFAAIIMVIMILRQLKETPSTTTYCKGGYVVYDDANFPRSTDRQVIGVNGGGVPCNVETTHPGVKEVLPH